MEGEERHLEEKYLNWVLKDEWYCLDKGGSSGSCCMGWVERNEHPGLRAQSVSDPKQPGKNKAK